MSTGEASKLHDDRLDANERAKAACNVEYQVRGKGLPLVLSVEGRLVGLRSLAQLVELRESERSRVKCIPFGTKPALIVWRPSQVQACSAYAGDFGLPLCPSQ